MNYDMVALSLLQGWRPALVLVSAHNLGLFDRLVNQTGRLTASMIAEEHGWDTEKLERLLEALCSLRFVEHSDAREPRSYRLTELGERFVDPNSQVRYMAEIVEDNIDDWLGIASLVKGWESRDGEDIWKHRFADSAHHEAFTRVMRLHAEAVVELIVESGELIEQGSVCDLGGGEGLILCGLLLQRPTLSGVLLERPEMVARAKSLPGMKVLGDRVRLVPGDLFALANALPAPMYVDERVLPPVSQCLLVNVLHDWPDDKAEAILRQAAWASKSVLIVERLDGPGTELLDLHMMAVTGGKQRSLSEHEVLLKKVGLALEGRLDHPSGFTLLVAK